MDFIKSGNFPNVAYFIPDGANLSARIPFKCRITSEGGQAFSTNIGGLVDVGTSSTIITAQKLTMGKQSKVILNDILYSVNQIVPYIPDSVSQGLVKAKLLAEYLVVLV